MLALCWKKNKRGLYYLRILLLGIDISAVTKANGKRNANRHAYLIREQCFLSGRGQKQKILLCMHIYKGDCFQLLQLKCQYSNMGQRAALSKSIKTLTQLLNKAVILNTWNWAGKSAEQMKQTLIWFLYMTSDKLWHWRKFAARSLNFASLCYNEVAAPLGNIGCLITWTGVWKCML